MNYAQGARFNMKPKEAVVDYIKSLNTSHETYSTRNLQIVKEDNQAVLQVNNGTESYHPIRKSFMYKLLKWNGISHHSTSSFSDNTILAVSNDILSGIKSSGGNVKIGIENGDAISILSSKFTHIPDLEIIEKLSEFNISTVSRDDFLMRIYTKKISESEPAVRGDICGYGYSIVNSETGFSPLSAEHFMLRYICSNGMTAPISTTKNTYVHYDVDKEKVLESILNTLNSAPSTSERLIKALKKSTQLEAEKEFPTISFQISSIVGTKNGYSFFDYFNKSKSSKYDLFNHITDKAKGYAVLERYQLEQLAGRLMLH